MSSFPSAFLFRQDIDYVDEKGLDSLLKITKKFGIRGTYFVNISGEEEFDEEIGHMKLKKPTTPGRRKVLQKILIQGNEIANHGYWHYVFDSVEENYRNIGRCSFYLKKLLKIKDNGFAAPGGIRNVGLDKAVNKSKFLYSCNTLSRKNTLPYYPKNSKVLEIPFFKGSDVDFEQILKSSNDPNRLRVVSEKLKRIYLNYIEQQVQNNKPIAILGHPHLLGKIAESVLPPIFRRISKLKIPNYTIGEFAECWKNKNIK